MINKDLLQKSWDYLPDQRVSVLFSDNTPAMPTKYRRAKKLLKENKAVQVKNKLGLFCIKLKYKESNRKNQPIILGIDPGKYYSGFGLQSVKDTLLGIHTNLPLCKSKKSNKNSRRMRGHTKENKLFEFIVAKEICSLYPVSQIIYEISNTKKSRKDWNETIIAQKWALDNFENLYRPVVGIDGTITASLRRSLGFIKQKSKKGEEIPETQVIDGITLASSFFCFLEKDIYISECKITTAPFIVLSKNNRRVNSYSKEKNPFSVNIVRRTYYNNVLRNGVKK